MQQMPGKRWFSCVGCVRTSTSRFSFTAWPCGKRVGSGQSFAREKAPQRDRFVPMLLVEAISHPVLFFQVPRGGAIRLRTRDRPLSQYDKAIAYPTHKLRSGVHSQWVGRGIASAGTGREARRRPGDRAICRRRIGAVPHRPPPPSW